MRSRQVGSSTEATPDYDGGTFGGHNMIYVLLQCRNSNRCLDLSIMINAIVARGS